MSKRLFINHSPKIQSKHFIELKDTQAVRDMLERYSHLQESPPLTLDTCSLQEYAYNQLLKFIEEYKGDITLFAKDNVPDSILSRFTEHTKKVEVSDFPFIHTRLRRAPKSLKDKVKELYG